MKYELIIFSCPNCAGMAKLLAEKCEYCGAPFYWKDDRMDKDAMRRKAEEVWGPPIMEMSPSKYLPQKVAATQWSKKLYIVVTHINANTNEVNTIVIDEVRMNWHDHKTDGDIFVDLRNERSCLFFDWLRMNDEYFQVQIHEDGEALRMMIRDCKVVGMEPVYSITGGQKIINFESPHATEVSI